jgi:molybdopterin synthase catalytic subunit
MAAGAMASQLATGSRTEHGRVHAMKVRLLAFASAGDAVGATELELEVAPALTVGELKARLGRDHPALAGLWGRIAVAVDGELAVDAQVLVDGAEVALLPPVSGGSATAERTAERAEERVAICEAPLDVGAITTQVAGADCGALVLFVGVVRNHHAGRRVERLTYTGYRPMALERLRRIVAELELASGARVAIAHRLGTLEPGVASVVIAVASAHRQEAYDTSRRALERLKAEVPIWKREHYAGGEAAWREVEPLATATREHPVHRSARPSAGEP